MASRNQEIQIFERIHQELTSTGSLLYAGLLLQRASKKFPTHIALIDPNCW